MDHEHMKQLRALAEAHTRLAAYHAAGAPGREAEEEASRETLERESRRYTPNREAISSGNQAAVEDAVVEAWWQSWKLLVLRATWRGASISMAAIATIPILGSWTGSFPDGNLVSAIVWSAPAVIAVSFVCGSRCARRLLPVVDPEFFDRRSWLAVLHLSLVSSAIWMAVGLGVLAFLDSAPRSLTLFALGVLVGSVDWRRRWAAVRSACQSVRI